MTPVPDDDPASLAGGGEVRRAERRAGGGARSGASPTTVRWSRLAWYNPMSAASSSSSIEVPDIGKVATPALMVKGMLRPSASTGSWAHRWRRASAKVSPASASAPGSAMTNSSPPNRANSALEGASSRLRSATETSTPSPASCP